MHEVRRPELVGVAAAYTFDGPPALASLLAVQGLFGASPDVVVSGINPGWNVGRAVHFSGTIGAVITAEQLGVPGVAVSQHTGDTQHWATAATVAARLVAELGPEPVGLNVNVPNVELDGVAGTRWTTLSDRIPYRVTAQAAVYDGITALPVSVLLENVRSMYNVGSFFRTCDAAGVEALHLCGFTGSAGILACARGRWALFTDGRYDTLSKKEIARNEKERRKLQKNLEGIRGMARLPEAIFIVDTKKEKIAVDEARKLKIPVIGIVDTNCDPDEVDYVIPGNDDALRSIRLFASRIADSVIEGRGVRESVEADSSRDAAADAIAEKGDGDDRRARPARRPREAAPASA